MRRPNLSEALRRSSRVQVNLPILVTSLEPSVPFSERCETLVVSAHGCAVRSPLRLDAGIPVHFQIDNGHHTMAHVVDCHPIGSDRGWRVGARLDRPENCWGLKPCPEDWMQLPRSPMPGEQKLATILATSKVDPPKMPMLRGLVAELIEPLQAEVAELTKRLRRGEGEANRSRFEVSLSHIPPEVEEKLWMRLRQDLGPQVLQQTREHSEQVLGVAQTAIEQRLSEAQDEFRQRAGQQLQALEQRAQGLSENIARDMKQQLHVGVAEIHQRESDACTRLERHGDEFLRAAQRHLEEGHAVQCGKMQQVQAAFAAESTRLQAQLTELGARIAKLDESARRLEADLDTRLDHMTSDAVSGARSQLENELKTSLVAHRDRARADLNAELEPLLDRAKSVERTLIQETGAWLAQQGVDFRKAIHGTLAETHGQIKSQVELAMEEVTTRCARELRSQLDGACARLKSVQNGIEASVSKSLGPQVTQALQTFSQTLEDLAQKSVGRWRLALARDLKSLTRILGEQFRAEAGSDKHEG